MPATFVHPPRGCEGGFAKIQRRISHIGGKVEVLEHGMPFPPVSGVVKNIQNAVSAVGDDILDARNSVGGDADANLEDRIRFGNASGGVLDAGNARSDGAAGRNHVPNERCSVAIAILDAQAGVGFITGGGRGGKMTAFCNIYDVPATIETPIYHTGRLVPADSSGSIGANRETTAPSMEAADWKYIENTFLSITEDNWELLTEIGEDHFPKLARVKSANAVWETAYDRTELARETWLGLTGALASAEGAYRLATTAFENKMASLTAQPDPETTSTLESWDVTVRGQVAYGGSIYTYLLPEGRSGFTEGTYQSRLDYARQFGERLAEQTAKPVLTALGITVAVWYSAAVGLRNTQTEKESMVVGARADIEASRVAYCQALHGNVGFGIYFWFQNPVELASLFDLTLIRTPTTPVPAAPGDTAWVPASRILSTTALPEHATRLEAWRLAPGGAPERLAIGERDALSVTIPPEITFESGMAYDLWLVARNARGSSPAGPVQQWTAP